jgi:hypothetical protein
LPAAFDFESGRRKPPRLCFGFVFLGHFDTGPLVSYSCGMDVEVTVSNYRCFSDAPVRFGIKKGLHAFVGVNNSGKSSLLRLFYELRSIFTALSNSGPLFTAVSGSRQPYVPMPLVKDPEEIFYDRNERDLVVGFDIPEQAPIDGAPVPSRFEIVILRATHHWYARVFRDGT